MDYDRNRKNILLNNKQDSYVANFCSSDRNEISKISGVRNKQTKTFLKDKKRRQIQNKNVLKIENRYRTIEMNP